MDTAVLYEVKAAGRREVDHTAPSCDEVKNEWNKTSDPPILFQGLVRDEVTVSYLTHTHSPTHTHTHTPTHTHTHTEKR